MILRPPLRCQHAQIVVPAFRTTFLSPASLLSEEISRSGRNLTFGNCALEALAVLLRLALRPACFHAVSRLAPTPPTNRNNQRLMLPDLDVCERCERSMRAPAAENRARYRIPVEMHRYLTRRLARGTPLSLRVRRGTSLANSACFARRSR